MRFRRSFGAIGTRDDDVAFVAAAGDPDSPGVAADFAVLDEAAADVGLDVDLDLLAAVRTRDQEAIVHRRVATSVHARPLAASTGESVPAPVAGSRRASDRRE